MSPPAPPLGALSNVSLKVKDPIAEKVRDFFINFLEKFQESETSAIDHDFSATQIPSSSALFSDSRPLSHHNENILTSNFLSSEPNQHQSQHATQLASSSHKSLSYYRQHIIGMRNDDLSTLFVDFAHLSEFNHVLAEAILEDYYRFEPYLRKAVTSFIQAYLPDYLYINASTRQKREFWVAFYNIPHINKLRELTTSKIGQLCTISGTVTRTSEVRPELYFGTFQCNDCRAVIKHVEQQFKYTEPTICQNPICGNRSNWTLLLDQSVFLDWQKVRVQENASEIPPGSMPRTLDVIVRNDLVERAKAGDKCDFTGCLIVIPDISQLALPGGKLEGRPQEGRRDGIGAGSITGLKALGVRELSYKLSFMACMVSPSTSDQPGFQEISDENQDAFENLSLEAKEEILEMKSQPNLYASLVDSVAPAIFGHRDVKAGILLQLFGGIHKVTAEGINLRGDINICIVGDPGTAKSQFLKYVTGFLPRSIYTSGKSASAAGLTASVCKDEETGEFTIEAGALMLADNGICAIDEFDKMDLQDQVAIHEAMEQQTISISKAGIQATLNARTSILAAANPIHGRYDTRKSLRQNIAMTAPIMSRFDLFFVVLDECDPVADYNVARHILSIHRLKDEAIEPIFSIDKLQRYIRCARQLKPQFSDDAAQLLADKYCLLRQNDLMGGTGQNAYRMTVRQLESMIRLSEALARLHMDKDIQPKYVREAYRLLKSSLIRVQSEAVDFSLEALSSDTANVQITDRDPNMLNTIPKSAQNIPSLPPPTKSLSVKYEDYVRISNMLVYQLRHGIRQLDAVDDDQVGMRRSVLEAWYLEQISEDMETVADLDIAVKKIRAIMDRLVHKDCVLIELKDSDSPQDPLLVVHPNYYE